MQSHQINHYSTYSVLKASIVEDFVDRYNNTLHKRIKMTRSEVNSANEKHLLDSVLNNAGK